MGQVTLRGADPAAALERLVPGNIAGLKQGRIRYTMFTTDAGGIIDDLMAANAGDHLRLVVNGARAAVDLDYLHGCLSGDVDITHHADRALVALQGPAAAGALETLAPECADMPFMSFLDTTIDGAAVTISRCGYTGEDGFEIAVGGSDADALARKLLAHPDVEPAGLGARDSLRLEAGLCLYGQDIDETTSPIEAGLKWTIAKRRLEDGGFPGYERIRHEAEAGPDRLLVGIKPEGKAPARAGVEVLDAAGAAAGIVTSGGFGATAGGPVAMGYVRADLAAPGTPLLLQIRKSQVPASVASLPFVAHRYHKP